MKPSSNYISASGNSAFRLGSGIFPHSTVPLLISGFIYLSFFHHDASRIPGSVNCTPVQGFDRTAPQSDIRDSRHGTTGI